MKLDPVKLVNQRQRLGYSQQDVADKSNVKLRTIQRAEAGISLSNESAASIAAALQSSPYALALNSTASEPPATFGKTITLRRVSSGRSVIDTFDETGMCRIDCEVEPTQENIDVLKAVANLLETNMPEPLNEGKLAWPLTRSLADRLDLVANLNQHLTALEALGISIFLAVTWVNVHLPNYDPYNGGFHWLKGKPATGCRAVRIVISEHGTEKIVRPARVFWPIPVEEDLDEDVPF